MMLVVGGGVGEKDEVVVGGDGDWRLSVLRGLVGEGEDFAPRMKGEGEEGEEGVVECCWSGGRRCLTVVDGVELVSSFLPLPLLPPLLPSPERQDRSLTSLPLQTHPEKNPSCDDDDDKKNF